MAQSSKVSEYLDLIDDQLDQLFTLLEPLPPERIWERPAPKKWCIGEIIDHTRVLDRSLRRILLVAAPILWPLGHMRRGKPYEAGIDDIFQRPGFPSQVGWLWSPKHRPDAPVPLARLREDCAHEHDRMRQWFEARDEAVLGHLNVYDPSPSVGWINFVQALQIAAHHDAHHFRAIARMVGHDWDAVGVQGNAAD